MAETRRVAGSRPATLGTKNHENDSARAVPRPVSEVEAKPGLEQTKRANGKTSGIAASPIASSELALVNDHAASDRQQPNCTVTRAPGSPMRPPSPTNRGVSKYISHGVDSLVVGFDVVRFHDDGVFDDLENAKLEARSDRFRSKGCPVTVAGLDFRCMPRGSRGYEYVILNDDVSILIAPEARGGEVYPELYVTFRARWLWREGDELAVWFMREWLGEWCDVVNDRVSRADLCVDMAMPLPDVDVSREVVTRAVKRDEYLSMDGTVHARGVRGSGYSFGAGGIRARLYDKSFEVQVVGGREVFTPVWKANGWDGETPVTRLEFQYRRGALKKFGISGYHDLTDHKPDLWRYGTCDWLRVCQPLEDRNRARWPERDWWHEYQACVDQFGDVLGVLPMRNKAVRLDELVAQSRGCAQSAWARLAAVHGKEVATQVIHEALAMDEAWFARAESRIPGFGRMN